MSSGAISVNKRTSITFKRPLFLPLCFFYFSCIDPILVYSVKNSNRFTYILKTLLCEGLGIDYKLTHNLADFVSTPGPKLNYSAEAVERCVNIRPHSILFDYGIKDYHLEVISHPRFYKIFFKQTSETIPFDLFGAAFWLLSRYEEYLPHKGDRHNRFHYKSGLAYQYEFLHLPLVNLWLKELKTTFGQAFPELTFEERSYNFLSSIDIDNAYKYKYKGFVRSLAGFISDRSFTKIRQRFRIILGREKDPFDCYDFLIDVHKQTKTQAIYFFLLGDYGPNDKNHSASDLRFQSLIKQLADYSMVGIHPSFGSNNNLRQLKIEVSRLSNITHKTITKSRQHFSMLRFPQTYQDLLQAGIFTDYSMGYTNQNGFRASYCFPFKWYSLDIESVSSLTVHPFCISENTLLSQLNRQGQSMMEQCMPLIAEVKRYNGQLISIFHNDNFNGAIKAFYQEFIREAAQPPLVAKHL